ncbi:MAG: DUF6444 domain-containing protein, partial [Candidatus Poribacteria bacterium]|nr:DUF6444 domain-containing protein [Candidatus Poribacteria bacterium]
MRLTRKTLQGDSKNQLVEVVLSLQEHLQLQHEQIKRLEDRMLGLGKNSQTSSKPPSEDQNKPKRNKGHQEHTGRQTDSPDEGVQYQPKSEG